jgi:hypothetical protein
MCFAWPSLDSLSRALAMASSLLAATTSRWHRNQGDPHPTTFFISSFATLDLAGQLCLLDKATQGSRGILPATYSEKYLIVSESSLLSSVNSLYSFFKYSSRYASGFKAALMATVNRNRVFFNLIKVLI